MRMGVGVQGVDFSGTSELAGRGLGDGGIPLPLLRGGKGQSSLSQEEPGEPGQSPVTCESPPGTLAQGPEGGTGFPESQIVKNFPKGYNHINTTVKSRNSEHGLSSLRIWMVHTWLCSFRAAAVARPYPGMLSYAELQVAGG